MKKYFYISLVAASMIGVGCKSGQMAATSSKGINNYATTTENMMNLSSGMSVGDVSRTLNCEPTDIYSNIADNEKILVYKYRKNFQNVPMAKENTEEFLRGGKPVFSDESNLYVVFDSKSNKMLYYITESGRGSGEKEISNALKIKYNDQE